MNTILVAGLAIFLGIITGKVFQYFKIPQVVGYIIVGVLIGKSFLHVLEGDVVQSLTPLVNFTLGVIGCVIGAELKGGIFKKYGKSIYTILVSEGVFAFLAVAVFVTLLTKKLYLGLILGAIASATDPASTVNVLWEYKAKGPLTRMVTSIVALDDGLALIIYGLVSVFSKAMILRQHFSWWEGLSVPILEILACLMIGIAFAVFVVKVLKYIHEEALCLSFILGMVAVCVGLSMYLKLDLILTSMAFGATIANLLPKISEKLFGMIKGMTTSLYILFFVAVGAQLDMHIFLRDSILGIVLVYLLARSFGKIFGATFGGLITHSKKAVTKYTGICLLTQGGVAMGLALSLNHNLSQLGTDGQQAGLLIINVVAATTFIVQLIGPPLVKWGITKADETNRDVTREDIVGSLNAADVMSRDFTLIEKHKALKEIIKTVKQKETYNFPIVDGDQRLVGQISLSELKDAIFEDDLVEFILAEDVAVSPQLIVTEGQPLKEVYEMFEMRDIDFIPVIDNRASNKVVGIIEKIALKALVDLKLLEQRHGLGDDLDTGHEFAGSVSY